jgi:hypothetical protein
MADLVIVRLIKSHGIWNTGELAGFQSDKAAELVTAGVAEMAAPVAAVPAPPPARGRKGR